MTRWLASLFLVVFVASGCSAQIEASNRPSTVSPTLMETPEWDLGGPLDLRMQEIELFHRLGLEKRIIGRCTSACTLWLVRGGKNACAEPDAMFGFHGPHNAGRPLREATFNSASATMAIHYPPRIRRAFLDHWRHLGPSEIHLVPAIVFIARGEIRQCD